MTDRTIFSKIQHRRGTQAQFNALYPPGYTGVGGCDISAWPHILVPGEIALCTDTRRVFTGNVNGEYFEIGGGSTAQTLLTVVLPPASSFTEIPELVFVPTSHLLIVYSVVDTTEGAPGQFYARTGVLEVTAAAPFADIVLTTEPDLTPVVLPDVTSVTLTDRCTELQHSSPVTVTGPGGITLSVLPDISFTAAYSAGSIVISYLHNFSSDVTFTTNSVTWAPT